MKSFSINTNHDSYPFLIGAGCIDQLPDYILSGCTKLLIVTDQQVAKLHLEKVVQTLESTSLSFDIFILPSGEEAKSFTCLEQLLTKAIEAGLDRKSMIISLGGGVVGDTAGFAAAIYMRGIPYLQIPTTILAHDSSIGGKVAINHPLSKNMIGAFYHPKAILYDTQFLLTLPAEDYCAGFAEMIKHAIISDAPFFSWLEEHTEPLLKRDLWVLEEALYHSAKIKAEIVKADEREHHIRALLNFGHTVGHAIESLTDYRVLHGEAVAIGMVAAARLSKHFFNHSVDLDRIESLLQNFQLPICIPEKLNPIELLNTMRRDKKAISGSLVMVLPETIGHAVIIEEIEPDWIIEILKQIDGGSHS